MNHDDPASACLEELIVLAGVVTERELQIAEAEPLDGRRLSGYVLGAVAAGWELAQGVLREGHAGAPANALRLARHLFELDIELHYVTTNPERRFEQLLAREAKNRLGLSWNIPEGVFEDPEFGRELKRLVKDAHRADAKALKRKKNGEDVLADELGWPGYEDKAKALGRLDDYNVLYGSASWSCLALMDT